MDGTAATRWRRRGFTAVEAVTATSIMSLVIGAITTWFLTAMGTVGDDARHACYIDEARALQQTITKSIQSATAVGVNSNALSLMNEYLEITEIRFEGGDPEVAEDNCLVYDPDPEEEGDEITLCTGLRPIEGEPMFQTFPTSPTTAEVSFQVGKPRPQNGAPRPRGVSYHGIEVRLSATPRNMRFFAQ